jgi:hypothetical protein
MACWILTIFLKSRSRGTLVYQYNFDTRGKDDKAFRK